MAAEAWTEKDEQVAEVREFVRTGGLALCYGKVAPALDDLLPVTIDRDQPRLDALVTLAGRALGLSGTPLREQAIRCTAKAETKVLAGSATRRLHPSSGITSMTPDRRQEKAACT